MNRLLLNNSKLRLSKSQRGLLIATAAFLCLLTVESSSAYGKLQEPKLRTNVSKNTVQVAESFELVLSVAAPAGSTVTFSPLEKQLGPFDVLDQQLLADIPSDDDSGMRNWSNTITLETIETGELTIPTMEVIVDTASESKDSKPEQVILQSWPVSIRVVSVLEDRADPTQFRDIAGYLDAEIPVDPPSAWKTWLIAGASGIGLAILTALAMVASRRRKWLSPKQWALGEINELESANRFVSERGPDLLGELSAILRNYLAMQFDLKSVAKDAPAGEGVSKQKDQLRGDTWTTNELLRELQQAKQLNPGILERYHSLFELAEQSQFAGLAVDERLLEQTIHEARELIEQTAAQLESGTRAADQYGYATQVHPSKEVN